MRLEEIAQTLNLRELTPGMVHSEDVAGGYASDLLSDVLAHAPVGAVLITLQVHLNVIAVASHAGLRGVIFSCNRVPEQDVIDRAAEENVCLYVSSADTFEIAGRLYELGLRGRTE
ncbi:MAG: serine kinase [Actinobacteria bacterium]|nr:serine kinase [Actinomycetota bacterium]